MTNIGGQESNIHLRFCNHALQAGPNHVHVVWEMKAKNGRELPHASFNKFTSHMILKDLKNNHPEVLSHFKVEEPERTHRIWQRDPLAVLMDSKQKVEQKIAYSVGLNSTEIRANDFALKDICHSQDASD